MSNKPPRRSDLPLRQEFEDGHVPQLGTTEFRPSQSLASSHPEVASALRKIEDNLFALRNAHNNIKLPKARSGEAMDLSVTQTQTEIINNPNPNPNPSTDPDDNGDSSGGCSPIALNITGTIDTGLTGTFVVRVLNEYAYIIGLLSDDPTLLIYRVKVNGKFSLISSLTLSQEVRRFIFHAGIIFGCNDGADSQDVLALDVSDVWNPSEVDSVDVGFSAYALCAQGGFIYVVGGTNEIAVITISEPSNMQKVN